MASTLRRGRGSRRQSPKTVFNEAGQLRTIVDLLGNNTTAEMLGVSRSQPSLWRRRLELMSPESRRKVSELYYLLDRLTQVIKADFVVEWLRTPQPHLSDSTPAIVFRLKGPNPVIEVIEAVRENAYQ
jgi:hypothetical protein